MTCVLTICKTLVFVPVSASAVLAADLRMPVVSSAFLPTFGPTPELDNVNKQRTLSTMQISKEQSK